MGGRNLKFLDSLCAQTARKGKQEKTVSTPKKNTGQLGLAITFASNRFLFGVGAHKASRMGFKSFEKVLDSFQSVLEGFRRIQKDLESLDGQF